MATVYVVDDEAMIRTVLVSVVGMMGLVAEAYGSAEEFLALYHPAEPGCLLLDMELPGMDGLELQAELKRRACKMPIIAITPSADETMKSEALRQGAIAVLEKPCRSKEVAAAVERAMELLRKAM
jgi:FixJ family two-component response regulator